MIYKSTEIPHALRATLVMNSKAANQSVPLLIHRFISFPSSKPDSLYYKSFALKFILKNAIPEVLPKTPKNARAVPAVLPETLPRAPLSADQPDTRSSSHSSVASSHAGKTH